MLAGLRIDNRVLLGQVVQHGDEPADPSHWELEPTIIIGVTIFVALYLYGVTRFRRRQVPQPPLPAAMVVMFLSGSAIFLLSLISPLDALSDRYLFSAHMVQHILISMIAPPLWIMGTPAWLLKPLVRAPTVAAAARFLTHPAVGFLAFHATFWLWHWPAFYGAALADEHVHAFQHLTFVATAVLNWWPVLSPLREIPALSYPLRVLYLFANCQPGVALGALLVFSRDTYYRAYEDAPRLFGLSAYADQQLGGLIMWVPGNAIYLFALTIIFLRWISHGYPDDQPIAKRQDN